jgi:hypothetical protein
VPASARKLFTFVLSLRNKMRVPALRCGKQREFTFMAGNFAREAALALLRWCRVSSDPAVTVALLEKVAEIRDRVGELPVPNEDMSSRAPDIPSKS